jgi:transposase
MTAYMGIDVAKHKHQAMVMNATGDTLIKAFPVTNDRKGINGLLDRLTQVDEPMEIGLEATGHYWLPLFEQLTKVGYTVHILNPLQVHAYQRSGIRRRKTDAIDAEWIADFVRIGGARDSVDPQTMPIYMELRQLSRFRFSLIDQVGNAKRRVVAVMDCVFPEYERIFSSVFIKTSRELLKEATTAQDFADFDLQELTTLLNKSSRGRFGEDEAQTIKQTAQQSIGISFLVDAARIQLGCLLAQLDFLEQQVAQIDQALDDLMVQLPNQYIMTITGIGPVTGAAILGEIGDIRRFPSLKKLVAYAGIDPTVYESGQFQAHKTRMSKRGSPHLRHALWMAAGVARMHDPELKAYYQKKRAEGKAYGTAMGAVCHKLLARIYAVLRDQRPYITH